MRRLLLLSMLALGLLTGVAPSQPEWEPVPAPVTGGLFNQPQMAVAGARLHLFWAGTGPKMPEAEVMHCWRNEDSDGWSEAKAPFFGYDQGRVRRLAVAATKHTVGMVFERQLGQGPRAMEVLFTVSPDNGWAWTTPVLVDSFVAEHANGTCVSLGAREHLQKVEYAAAWATEGQGIKAAMVSLRDNVRAPARSLGRHGTLSDRVQIAGHTKGGFAVVWSDQSALRSVRLKPLSGEAEEPQTLVTKGLGSNFGLATRARGPLELFSTLNQESFMFRFNNDGEWQREQGAPPPAGSNVVAAMDGEDKRYVLFQSTTDPTQVLFSHDAGGSWSAPEPVFTLKNPQSGFTIACTDNYVWVAAVQGATLEIKRRKK